MSRNKLYAKFISLKDGDVNQNKKLKNILDEKLYFSNVFNLNDINEGQYAAPYRNKEDMNDGVKMFLKNEIVKNGPVSKEELIYRKFTSELANEIYEWSKRFNNINDDIPDRYVNALIEYLAVKNVGICSFSSCEIFEKANSHLMFSHYGGNLRGVVLIFSKSDSKMKQVIYDDCVYSFGAVDRYKSLINNEYKEMNDFERKLKIWSYEMESRLFASPGSHDWGEFNLELELIFYTGLTPEQVLESLKNKFSQIMHLVYPGYGADNLFMINPNGTPVHKFLKNILNKKNNSS